MLGEIDSKPIRPLGSVDNRLAVLGISPYANTLPSTTSQPNPTVKFNFTKLRDF